MNVGSARFTAVPGSPFLSTVERLRRHLTVRTVDDVAGTAVVTDGTTEASLQLPPEVLGEYLAQLTGAHVPQLKDAPAEKQAEIKVRHLVLMIEELIDSNLAGGRLAITLSRQGDGELSVERDRPTVENVYPPPLQGQWDSQADPQ